MQTCPYCGKEYKLNVLDERTINLFPEEVREKIKYIPDCDCLLKIQEKEMEELETKRVKDCEENKINQYRSISVIDSKFLKSKFDGADMDPAYMKLAFKFAKKIVEVGSTDVGMILYGNAGTGKTFASACIANYLMDNYKTVLVINLSLYITKLKLEFSKERPDYHLEEKFLKSVETADLLIIDDVGTEKVTEFTTEKLFNLIDKRYRLEKSLIITTNLTVDFKNENECGLCKYYSADKHNRVYDRLKSMCFPVLVEGESRRKILDKDKFKEFLGQ